ncbi:MAG: hypothetical protein JSU91_07460 [Thermoplasmatales archaeon]|nr:MAG: hypothetical protein JSU91_07460 [Thermoplasmatales archaeon]
MNGRRRKSNVKKTKTISRKIIRCSNKMIPVFESDTCENFTKKVNSESTSICKNCVNSF